MTVNPPTSNDGDYSPAGIVLGVIASVIVVLAAIGTAVSWFVLAALSTGRTGGQGIHPDLIVAGWIAIVVFAVAFVLVVLGFYFARRPSPRAHRGSIACGVGSIGVLLLPVFWMYAEYQGARARDVENAQARQRVDDLSATGRPCRLLPDRGIEGDCPDNYSCVSAPPGAQPGTVTANEFRCVVLCWGRDWVCGGGGRCVAGMCAAR